MMMKMVYSMSQQEYSWDPLLLVQLSRLSVLANSWVSVKHSKVPVDIEDIVKKMMMNSVFKSDRAYNNLSPFCESGSSISLSNNTRTDIGRHKRSLECDHPCRRNQSGHWYSDSELLDKSTVWKDRPCSADPVSPLVGSRKCRVNCAVTLALSSNGESRGSCTHSINHFYSLANSIFIDVDCDENDLY